MAVATVAPGDPVASEDHNTLAGLVNGTTGYGEPAKFYELNDSTAYSVIAGNQDTTNGYAFKAQYGALSGTPTTILTASKTGVTVPNLPFWVAGTTSPIFGGFKVDPDGTSLFGKIVNNTVPGDGTRGANNSAMVGNLIEQSSAAGTFSTFDYTARSASADSSCSQFNIAVGKVANRSDSNYTPVSPGPSTVRGVDVNVYDGGWTGLIAAPNTLKRWGYSVGFQTNAATLAVSGANADQKVGFLALSDANVGQFVDAPASTGTGGNAAFYAGGGGGGGAYASATSCAWEWPFYAAGTSNTAGLFCVYRTGRTGIAMVPQITSRGGMLQVNQDSNNDDGAGLRLFKNASTVSYTSMHFDSAGNTTVKSVLSGTGNSQFALASNATLTAFEVTSATSQSGNLLKLTIGGGSTMFAVSAAADLLIGAGHTAVGSGAGVIALKNASTAPTTNPSGGGVLYAEGGALKWRGSGGTVTTIANA